MEKKTLITVIPFTIMVFSIQSKPFLHSPKLSLRLLVILRFLDIVWGLKKLRFVMKLSSLCFGCLKYLSILLLTQVFFSFFLFNRSYTGYIDIEARHFFFYFFESRSNPDKDDVIFWTNGGKVTSSTPIPIPSSKSYPRTRLFFRTWPLHGTR